MIRLLGGGVVGLALLALWAYCIFDVISSDDALVRNLPKMIWLVIVIFIPTIGSVAWLALGRPPYASWRPGGEESRPPRARPVLGPEDAPDFPASRPAISDESRNREARLRSWEEDLRRARTTSAEATRARPLRAHPPDPDNLCAGAARILSHVAGA